MRPNRARIIPGVARRMVWNAPVRLVSSTASPVLVGHAHEQAVAGDAGVVHEDRRRAERRLDLAERGVDGAASATSACTASALPPSASTAAPRLLARRRRRTRSRTPTGWPARASATAIARPMPRDRRSRTRRVRCVRRRSRAHPSAAARCAQVMPAPKPEQQHEVAVAARGRRRPPRTARAGSTPTTCCRSGRCSRASARSGSRAACAAASMMRTLAWCGTNHVDVGDARRRRARASPSPTRRRRAPRGGTPPGPAIFM